MVSCISRTVKFPQCVFIYLNDIIVSSNEEQHLKDLDTVFEILQAHNMKLKKEKCQFMKTETKFLGHIINSKGINVDPGKIKAVSEIQQPKKVTKISWAG